MKNAFVSRKWKRIASAGLSLAMCVSLFSSVPVSAAPSEKAAPQQAVEKVPVKDKTPVTDKAGPVFMSQLDGNETQGHPFPKGTAGSNIFRIPAMITMETGELLAIADIRYSQTVDGNGLDTIAAISGDGGKTWEYGFPFYFPDSYRDSYQNATAAIDPGLLEGPDGTIYCIADIFPTYYSLQNVGPRLGTGYVTIDGEERLALTDDYANVGTKPEDENDTRYLYYVGNFLDGYAQILKREDHMPTGYAVDEWYNLYTVDEQGAYHDDLTQPQINNEDHRVQQNVYYRDSKFHVFETGYLWLITSKDHGRTWEHPRDIASQVRRDSDGSLLISPGCGLTTSDGTLVIGAYHHTADPENAQNRMEGASLLYSSDNGITWNRTEDIPGVMSSENEVVELEDGTIRMFYRGHSGKVAYADFVKNEQGGYDVGSAVTVDECSVTSTCNMGAIAYSKKIDGKQVILVSMPQGPNRANGKVFTFLVNDDAGKTMRLIHTLDVEGGGESFTYSNMTELPDGSVGLLWEGGGYNTEIWYERYDISDFAPGQVLESADGSENIAVTVEKGEDFVNAFNVSGNGGNLAVETEPNQNVATAKVDKSNATSVKAPVYSYVSQSESMADAFNIASSEPSTLELTDLEFTFNKNENGSWHVKNQASGQWLTLNGGGDNHFENQAENMELELSVESGGRITLGRSGSDRNGILMFHKPWMRFNRLNSQLDGSQPELTLWEKGADASQNSKIPGYQKVEVTEQSLESLSGKSCLITAEVDGCIILLNPQNGMNGNTKLLMPQAAVPVYSHAQDASDMNTAFATDTATPYMLELTDAECTFTKNSDKYHVFNEATQRYLTFNTGTASEYFNENAHDIIITPQDDGTVQMSNEYLNNTGCILFFKNQMNWNRTTDNTNNAGIYSLALWERTENAPADSKIPGYQKVIATNANIDGKRYLITAEVNDKIVLLYPDNSKKERLLGDIEQAIIRTPVKVEEATKATVTITGVNEGFTKAVIAGIEYYIQVTTDHTVYGKVGENIDIALSGSYEVKEGQDKATVTEVGEGTYSPYDHVAQKSESLDSFSKEKNQDISLADAEFAFTKDTENENQWFIKRGDKYFINDKESRELFGTDPVSMTVARTSEGAATFRFSRNFDGTDRYFIFYAPQMNFNAWGGLNGAGCKYDLTLWKKDASVTDGVLPGYQKMAASEEIEDGGVYLMTYIFEADGKEHVILFYPKDGAINSIADDITKLYRADKSVRITPTAAGKFQIVVDGETYKYQFSEVNCTHAQTQVKGYVDADCESDGYTGDTVCVACNEVTTPGKSVDALGHAYAEAVVKQALTEERNGIALSVCSNNGYHQKKTVTYASAYKRLKELFQEAPEEISEAQKAKYREADVAAVTEAYNSGKAVSQKEAAQQTNKEMYGSIDALVSAKTKMHAYRKNVESQLAIGITDAKPIHDKGQQGYSKETWDAFEAAYTAAVAVTDAAQKSYAELEALVTTLKETSSVLSFESHKASLQEYYDAHKDKDQNDYTSKTWKIFEDALNKAKSVLDQDKPAIREIEEAEKALRNAVESLRRLAEEIISVPGSIVYTAPAAGQYPKAAAIAVGESDTKHTFDISDWTEETPTLVRKDASAAAEIVKKDGIWGFNDQLKSDDQKYDVNGEKSMAVTFKLWLNAIENSNTVEILAKGQQYSIQLKNGALTLWMLYDGYPTEEFTLNAEEHAGKWLDVVAVINGKDRRQRLYVNGKASQSINEGEVNLYPATEPFTVGYRDGGDGIPFTKDIGYLADIKFYDCGADDVTEGLTCDYEAVVNSLNVKTPNAIISADPFDANTVWSVVTGNTSTIIEGNAKFAENTSYKAVTTLQAHEEFTFPTTEEFRNVVKEKVTTGKEDASVTVAVSEDGRSMTIEVSYLTEGAVTPAECTCGISGLSISGGTELVIPSDAEQGTLELKAEASVEGSCQVEGHPGANAVTYAYAIKEGADSNTAGASLQQEQDKAIVTATQEGRAVVTVTATLADGTESAKSKTEEVTITVTKAKAGEFIVSFDKNAGEDKVDGMPKNATVKSGTAFAKPAEIPTRTGHVFKGWSKTADGAAIADADWPQTIEADTTFYAVWESEAATPGECTCGITKVTISGGSRITIPATAESGTLQLGASAEVGSCQVEGHPDGNTVTYAYAIKEGAENNTAGASVDANTGFVTATREGKAVITVTATLTSGTESGKSKTEEVTITVTKAEEGTLVVRFDANAGGDKVDGMPEETSVESGKTLAKPAEVPTRAGHVFKGWSRTADGAVIADADWPQTISEDTTFYAVWEKESGNITQEEAEAAMTEAISAAERLLKFAQGNYTAESWAVFEAAYNAAKNPAAGISAAELKQLADSLASAQGQLVLDQNGVVENANKTIAAADAKFAEVSKGTKAYEAGSWAAYQTAYEALKKAIAENADAETLNGLYQALAEAESLLKEDTAWMDAKGALTKALKTAKPKHDKGAKAYTSATWKPFKTAYDNANKQKNATASSCTASKLKQLAERLDSTRKALKNAPVLKKGDSIVKNNVKYVVTNAGRKTVRAEGVKSKKNKKFSVNILSTVTIKGFKCNVTEVKAKAFYKFTKITKVTIGKKVTKIGKQAFEGCKAVTTLTVSGDVKTFDKQSFNGCKKLKKVVFKGKKVPAFKSKAFKGTASNMRVTLNKKMSKKNKAKMKTALKKAGVSKKAKIK